MMNKVFVAGNRFDKMRNLCVFANLVVVFVFYFIYRYLFEAQFPGFVGTPMVILFVLFGAATVKATLWVGDKLKASIRYEIAKDCLIVSSGKTQRRYPWANFTSVNYEKFRMRDIMPVSFTIAGENLMLNQYVDDIYDLTYYIIKNLDPSVPVDEEITKRVNMMR